MVAQEDDFGCGVACVANLLNISYQSALSLFKEPQAAKTRGYYCRDIVNALTKADDKWEFKYLKPKLRKEIYKPGTIVFIKRSKDYPAGHFLLRVEKEWIDPWINFPQKPHLAGTRKILPGTPIYLISSK